MRLFFVSIFIAFVISSCSEATTTFNHFTSNQDTLIVKTQKQKGAGIFSIGAGGLEFTNSNKISNTLIIPNTIDSIKYAKIYPDFEAIDTNFFNVIKGYLDGKEVFIIDQNNNLDFTDETINTIGEFEWKTSNNLIKIDYSITNGNDTVIDSTWISLGYAFDHLLYGKREHLLAKISIDQEPFTLGVVNESNTFYFDYNNTSEIAIISQNNVKVDSLNEGQLLKIGEFLKLGNTYYKFDKISKTGEHLTLIKEVDFSSKVGTQLGMLAPQFVAVTIAGDSIISDAFKDKPLIVANSCGCGGDIESTQAYFNILDAYKDKAHVIRLDSRIEDSQVGIQIDVENEYNTEVYKAYRQMYCSRICYVIGPNNRIVNKFRVNDWEQFLPDIINTKN
ncbi:hypothetical protein [Psychroserpens sp. MEBiC05023]